jgi:hypothetical protein
MGIHIFWIFKQEICGVKRNHYCIGPIYISFSLPCSKMLLWVIKTQPKVQGCERILAGCASLNTGKDRPKHTCHVNWTGTELELLVNVFAIEWLSEVTLSGFLSLIVNHCYVRLQINKSVYGSGNEIHCLFVSFLILTESQLTTA